MEEDIEVLKDFLELREIHSSDNCRTSYLKTYQKAVRNLTARYKETKQELESVKEIYYTQKEIETNYIKKSKVKEKIDSKFKEAKGLYERGVQPQAQFTMKLLRDLEKELLED